MRIRHEHRTSPSRAVQAALSSRGLARLRRLLLAVALLTLCGSARAQTLDFALGAGAAGLDRGNEVAVDGEGNTYVTGSFRHTVDFDPHPVDVFDLQSAGGKDIFVAKYGPDGDFIWAVRMGGPDLDEGHGIAVDEAGYARVTGAFHDTADFDPGPATYDLTSFGGSDIFLAKLDPNGAFVFARQFGGDEDDVGRAVALNDAGSAHLTGSFRGTADFNPGFGGVYITSRDSADIFVAKYGNNGGFVFARSDGNGGDDEGRAIHVADGYAYVTGYFSDALPYVRPPGHIVAGPRCGSIGGRDVFVSRYNSLGDLQWDACWGGVGDDVGEGISISHLGIVYVTGSFENTIDYDNDGVPDLTSQGLADAYLTTLERATGTMLNAFGIGGTGRDEGLDVAGGPFNAYVIGGFEGTADFDPSGWYPLATDGSIDFFVASYTTTALNWVFRTGDTDMDIGRGIDAKAYDVHVTGAFREAPEFNPSNLPPAVVLTSQGLSDVFVAKYVSPGLQANPVDVANLQLDPFDQVSSVPASGGPLPYRFELHNPTAAAATVWAWLYRIAPDGARTLVHPPDPIHLAPGETHRAQGAAEVPASTPEGRHRLVLFIGEDAETAANGTGFFFTKDADTQQAGIAADAPDGADAFVLEPNYPDPFNPSTEIHFVLPAPAAVRLAVYDVLGREVARLLDGPMPEGRHGVRFDGSGLASGTYLYRLEAGPHRATGTMLLTK